MKKITVLLAFLIALFLFPVPVFAQEAFIINNYNVNAVYNENNTADITEEITVTFQQSKHGIYRTIPTETDITNTVNGQDVTQHLRVKISNISVKNNNFETSRDNGDVVIKIGDADKYVNGMQKYIISYTMDFGNDKINEYDYVYLSLITTNWDTTVQNASFTVTMPKSFNTSLINFTAGNLGSLDNSKIKYSVNGNTVNANLTGGLSNYQGVSLKIQLDEGYFTVPKNLTAYYYAAAAVIGLIAVVILFFLFGMDRKYFQTVEFYPPEEMTPAEVGYIIDGTADNKDITSLITYWADKGFLSIEEKKDRSIDLIRLNGLPDSAKVFEKTVFEGLFRSDDRVNTESLKNTFYKTMASAKSSITDYFSANKSRKIFETKSEWIKYFTLLIAAGLFVLNSYTVLNDIFFSSTIAIILSAFPGGLLILTGGGIYYSAIQRAKVSKKIVSMFKVIIAIVLFAGIPAFYVVMALFASTAEFFIPYIISIVCVILIIFIGGFMSKRTQRGTELLGKIMGLKTFIEKAEKEKLEMLVNENPSYYYNILPYAYVLGVTNIWIKKFESITIQPANWYTSPYGTMATMNYAYMTSRLMSSMNTMQTSMVSMPQTSGSHGGGFSSGGGFSGGGFGGGGGGGSW